MFLGKKYGAHNFPPVKQTSTGKLTGATCDTFSMNEVIVNFILLIPFYYYETIDIKKNCTSNYIVYQLYVLCKALSQIINILGVMIP